MARSTRTPKIKWLAYTYAEKLLAGVRFDNHSRFSLHYFHYDLCVNQVQVFTTDI